MKLLSLFSGIGAFEAALDNIGIDFELVGYCEIDKYASRSYSAIHGVPESMNFGDITKIDEKKLPKDIDLVTYGFPCQDISLAGKQKGLFNEDGTQTRSGLFFEALRIIEETQPKIAIAENVKNLVSKKFKEQFEIVLSSLEQAGYNNYWKVLNAKDYGIPQNRERVFIISIRKDIDTGLFQFPEPFELKLRLKDLLEDEVNEKFYINKFQYGNLIKEPCGSDVKVVGYMTGKQGRFERHQSNTVYGTEGICPTQYAGQYKDPFRIEVKANNSKGYDVAEPGDYINIERPNSTTRRGMVGHGVSQTLDTKDSHCVVTSDPFIVASRGRNPENPSDRTPGCPTEQRLEPNSQGICNTLTTVLKDNLVAEPNVLTPKRTEYGKEVRKAYEAGEIVESRHNMTEMVPRTDGVTNTLTTVQKDNYVVEPVALDEQNKYIRNDGCVGTLTTDGSSPKHNNRVIQTDLRIRKLTPKECYRLMGFDDEDFERAAEVNSNTQLYKQAGNSIVVDVLEELFCMMFDEDGELYV